MKNLLSRIWRLWDEDICGDWTENKLLSRKWMLVFAVVFIAMISDVVGHELGPNTTSVITIVVPAFVAIQGFIDMVKYKAKTRPMRRRNESSSQSGLAEGSRDQSD